MQSHKIIVKDFHFEAGGHLDTVDVLYHTSDREYAKGDKVVWICHALTGNSDPQKTAEMTKVVENTYRAVNIAFANELAKICRHDNMDVYEIIRICNLHPRVNILQPGCGVGGHCIAVDPYFITAAYPHEAQIIAKAREINNYKAEWCVERVKNAIFMATLHRTSPYLTAYEEAQRMAMEADPTFREAASLKGGEAGLRAARAIALISYRSYEGYKLSGQETVGPL